MSTTGLHTSRNHRNGCSVVIGILVVYERDARWQHFISLSTVANVIIIRGSAPNPVFPFFLSIVA